jgi:Undecaprenyl-phosphate glucose phosphotransferase
MFAAICNLLGVATEVGLAEFIFLSVAAFAVYLLYRFVVAQSVNSFVAAGWIRTSVVFLVVEGGERAPAVGHETSRFQVFLLPSFARAEPARLRQLVSCIRASAADEIHLATRSATLDDCKSILAELRKVPLPVKLVANPIQAELLSCPLTKSGADFAFEVQRAPLSRPERLLKRGFDFIVSIALVVALFPLLVVVYALVRLTSRGPALFRQTRRGFNGRLFTIYKFRTMRVAENGEQIRQAERNDSRVTPLGRILRKTSLDELPQLFNVLAGDMSLIGPRPHAAAHDDAFTTLVASYAARQRVKPGITGWAQVCGCRGETSTPDAIERRTELDLLYIERWSMWLDLWIFVRTFFAIAFPKNAY